MRLYAIFSIEVVSLKDIPVFTTQLGAASLVLSQIPYTKAAYIRIQSTLQPEAFLQECISFCRAVGAEHIYATGHSLCESFPEHTRILKMQASTDVIDRTDACLFPVTEQSLSRFVEIYNRKIVHISNGAWMDRQASEKLLRDGNGYFIHRDGTLLGIAMAAGEKIDWVASVQPGAGTDVVRALCNVLSGETVALEVASTNRKAIDLYESLGFAVVQEICRWYCVL